MILLKLFKKGYGIFSISIYLFILFYSLSNPAHANFEDGTYLEALLKKAEEDKLYNDRYWGILLYYKSTLFGIKSLIDDPRFFLSPKGKYDPKSELEATIKAFFSPEPKDNNHPKCRFIARYLWLKEKLNIDESKTPDIICQEFNQVMDRIKPRRAVLVFPSFYMNNPSSMFGHTLIRIDSSYQNELLSYAANYAAQIEDAGILYPFKGIFGFYKGYFKVFPYYDRIKEYNNTEQRDMWEYRLNLSEKETKRMLMHLWELKDIYSYYYFFDENCSYNILFLLEAARPSLHLTDEGKPWVIPVETIRKIKGSWVVEGLEFRPSRATKIRHIVSLLDENSQVMALKIVNQELMHS